MASTESQSPSRRQVPFGGHQLAEYTIAAALIAVGIHLSGRPALAMMAGGGLVAALSLVSKGPLAAARLLPKKIHLYTDIVVAACFALSPLAYLHDLQVIPVILSEAVAVLLVRMSLTTEIVPRPRPEREGPPSLAARLGGLAATRATPRPPEDAVVVAARAERPRTAVPEVSEAATAAATAAGRVVGSAVARARTSNAPRVAARGLGRATGHARRIGRVAKAAKAAKVATSTPRATPVPPAEPGSSG